MMRSGVVAGLALALPLVLGFAADARDKVEAAKDAIVCKDEFQVVEGQQIESPYCEEKYLAKVARDHGQQVDGSQLRNNPELKAETCRLVGDDNRASEICNDTQDED